MKRDAITVLAVMLTAAAGCQSGWAELVGVDDIDARQLAALQQQQKSGQQSLLLLDVRDRQSYEEGHPEKAISVSVEQLDGFLSSQQLLRSRDTRVVTICYHGNQSIEAAAIVAAWGFRAHSLSGGMRAYREAGLPVVTGKGTTVTEEQSATPSVETTLLQQLAISVSAFGIKPLYMLLSFLVIIILRGRAERDLTLIRRSMIYFLIGEGICALNFFVGGNAMAALEIAHGFGMVLMGVFLPWGLFELLDDRVLHLADSGKRCAVQRFCGRCWKREHPDKVVGCGAKRLFLFLCFALAVIALVPWCSPLQPFKVTLPVFGSDVPWQVTLNEILINQRLYPMAAVTLFLVAIARLWGDSPAAMTRAKAPFFWGLGFMTFSLLRYFLQSTYREMPIWGDWWEETTELLTVGGLLLTLAVFRGQLELQLPTFSVKEPTDADR